MEEIVKKVASRVAKPGAGGVPGSSQPHQDREFRVAIDAESLGGMKKRATVTPRATRGQHVLDHL